MITAKDISRFWSKVDKADDNSCWLWKGARNKKGYGMFRLWPKMIRAHRVAYQLTHGEIQEGLLVCHTCDNPPCCNPSHLFLGTVQDNVNDKMKKGRINPCYGENNKNCKLSDMQVAEIRRRYSSGNENQTELARAFGVSNAHISDIVGYKTRAY